MNIELLNKVKTKILEEPENLKMEMFHCGSAHCIGGWAQVLSGRGILNSNNREPAMNLLALTTFESYTLFDLKCWPDKFLKDYEDNIDDKQYLAKITIERIDHFIATKGRE